MLAVSSEKGGSDLEVSVTVNVRADGQDNFYGQCCLCLEVAVSGGLTIRLL